MDQGRSSQIRKLVERALELDARDREAYIAELSLSDPAIGEEVLRRLRDTEGNTLSLNLSIPIVRQQVFEQNQIVGGRFRILRFLGQGGMGVVYEAEDLELGGRVALKTILPEIAAQREILSRFRKEIQLSRKVTHSNVCRVFDVARHSSQEGDVVFLTMELLHGETLAERLRHDGRMELRAADPLVLQMIHGLSAAHRAGVVHRDFKPGNVYLVPDSGGGTRVVITDFGLARTVDSEQTITEAGHVVGTAAYMAPEQLLGEEATPASDLYALGIVMFEMLTGHKPFEGAGLAGSMKRLTSVASSPRQYVPDLDRRWEQAILRCLEKDPAKRFASAHQLEAWLADGEAEPVAPRHWWWIAGPIGLACVLMIGGLWWWSQRPSRATAPLERPSLTQLTLDAGFANSPTFSADGKLMAFSSDRSGEGNLDIWAEYQGGTPIRVTNSPENEDEPALSPDGSTIVYRSERDGGGLYLNAALGGNERLFAKYGRNARFSPDGKYVAFWTGELGHFVVPSGKLYIVPVAGGLPLQLRSEFVDARYPVWTGDGAHILFEGLQKHAASPEANSDWWVTDISGASLVKTGAFDVFRGQNLRLFFTPPGWWKDQIVFSAGKTSSTNLWRVPLSRRTWQVAGQPQPVTFGAALETAPWVLPDGRVAFTSATGTLNIWEIPISSKTGAAAGKPKQVTQGTSLDTRPSLSADGRTIAFARRIGAVRNVWIRHLETGRETTLASSEVSSSLISPDAKTVAYSTSEGGKAPIYVIPSEGGLPRKICEDCGVAMSWSPDASTLLYVAGRPTAIYALDVAAGKSSLLLKSATNNLDQGQISPDGRWVAFVVRLSGDESRIGAAQLRGGTAAAEPDWLTLVGGKTLNDKPRWSADGTTLYFYSTRDGFPCLWRQRLDPLARQPVGDPLVFAHFHDPELSLIEVSRPAFNFAVSRDRMILNVSGSKANIWITRIAE